MVDNEPDLLNWHFEPAELTVTVGSTVVWHNDGKQEHTVTADDKTFDSGYQKPGADWPWTFRRPGQFSYHCAPHPWMKGVVQVVAASSGGNSATTTTVTTTATTTTVTTPATTTPSAASSAPQAAPAGSRRPSGSGRGIVALVVAAVIVALVAGAAVRRSRS